MKPSQWWMLGGITLLALGINLRPETTQLWRLVIVVGCVVLGVGLVRWRDGQ